MWSQIKAFSTSTGSCSVQFCASIIPQFHYIFSLCCFQSAYLFVFLFFVYVWASSNDFYVQEEGRGGSGVWGTDTQVGRLIRRAQKQLAVLILCSSLCAWLATYSCEDLGKLYNLSVSGFYQLWHGMDGDYQVVLWELHKMKSLAHTARNSSIKMTVIRISSN